MCKCSIFIFHFIDPAHVVHPADLAKVAPNLVEVAQSHQLRRNRAHQVDQKNRNRVAVTQIEVEAKVGINLINFFLNFN